MRLEGRARSKVNLYLKVTRRRPDRYHDLASLFQPLEEPFDRIAVETGGAPGVRVTSSLPGIPCGLDNLAGRAALAYAEAAKLPVAFDIFIEKNIPVAAGMGGGSSDAATVLAMLEKEFHRLGAGPLAELALTLGADVPFFLEPALAVARGVGEKLVKPSGRFLPPPLLVVNPLFPVSAKWSYTHLDPELIGVPPAGELERLLAALQSGDAAGVAKGIRNDLAMALYKMFPLLTGLRELMLAHGALNAEITGSGPSLFAVCADFEGRDHLADELKRQFSPELVRVIGNIPSNVIDQTEKQ
ncbi:MAG: 4-(cytidine 5'-diphospho)-2-C-methyl-D-erythritol kinase [Victivallaceae bacterium]|nr:4-(cytidine 5'-diphospho)-2-C-methyl-D-erythritol kinase [Victivallaceae bacterium]